jgi:hypothetical protein
MRLEFTLDCSDLDRTAEFWQAAAGFVVDGRIEGRYVSLSGHGVTLTLQRVAERKTVKNWQAASCSAVCRPVHRRQEASPVDPGIRAAPDAAGPSRSAGRMGRSSR